MFTPLDNELFPEDCRVVHMPLCDQWVYFIQKNGSSSLRSEHKLNNYRLYSNEEIRELEFVDIYIRDARSRYISGVGTFLEFLNRDHPELDSETILWFAKNYKFLNRHYLPQFFWLLNLSRYLADTAQLRFRRFEDFGEITKVHKIPTTTSISEEFQQALLNNNRDIELWFFIDQILEDLNGRCMTWHQLLAHYRDNHSDAWKLITNKTFLLLENVLPKA